MKNTTAMKVKQVPRGYLVVGVDPHKKRHTAVAMTQGFTTKRSPCLLICFRSDFSAEGIDKSNSGYYSFNTPVVYCI